AIPDTRVAQHRNPVVADGATPVAAWICRSSREEIRELLRVPSAVLERLDGPARLARLLLVGRRPKRDAHLVDPAADRARAHPEEALFEIVVDQLAFFVCEFLNPLPPFRFAQVLEAALQLVDPV